MPYTLLSVWRARRVLLLGGADERTQILQAHLTALGARPVSIPPDTPAEPLYRAMTDGRVSAVIACVPLTAQALRSLETERVETGVPLALLFPENEGDAQETALSALLFIARFFEDALPGGLYRLSGGQFGEACRLPAASHPRSCPADTGSG